MIGSLGGFEIAIIALVVILLFGVGKLSGLGKGLGESIKEFRSAVKDEKAEDKTTQQTTTTTTQTYVPPPAQPQQPPQQSGDPNKNNIF